MKKILLVGAALAVSPAVHAGDFYVGAGAGYGFGSAKTTADLNSVSEGYKKTDAAVKGLQGTVFGGWGTPVQNDKFYMGFELSLDLSDVKGNEKWPIDAGANSISTLHYQYGINAQVKTGLFLDPTKLIYAKVGPTVGSWSLDTKTDTADPATGNIVPQTANRTSNLMGLKVALGAEAEIASNTYAGFEYSYALYQKMSVKKTASTGENFSYQTQPSLGVFMVTLTRKF